MRELPDPVRPLTLPPSRAPDWRAAILERAHSPQDLREAITVTARGDQHQVEIQLGHLCNNTCLFCVSGQLTQDRLARPIPLEPVLESLRGARAQGIDRVTFLGGEPTIQRSFLPALRAAVELGFPDIVIFTNLVRGREPRFLEEVCALGRFSWRISIQGGDEATHDAVVGRPGAWAKIQAGLEWLGARGHDMTANACINAESYRSVEGYVSLVQRTGLRSLHLDMVRPGSTGRRSEEHQRALLAPYSAMAPFLGAMLDGFDAWDPEYEVNVGNFPFCLLPRHAHRIAHGGEDTLTVTTDDSGALGRIWDKYAHQGADKVLADACAPCVFKASCRGVPAEYARFHGLDELQPVDRATVQQLDPRVVRWLDTGWRPGREPRPTRPPASVLRVIRRLRAGGPYAGWRAGPVRATEDGRGVILRIEGTGVDAVEVRVAARPSLRVSFAPAAGTSTETARGAIEAAAAALRPAT